MANAKLANFSVGLNFPGKNTPSSAPVELPINLNTCSNDVTMNSFLKNQNSHRDSGCW